MKAKRLVLAAGVGGLLSVGAVGLGVASAQDEAGEAAALTEYEENTISVVERYGPSVVSISVTAQAQGVDSVQAPEGFEEYLDQFQLPPQLREFFEQQQGQQQLPPQQGSGSGFVIDEAGRMVTNFHVVEAALQESSVDFTEGSSVTVTFPGSEDEFPVNVVGVNTLYDFALLELQNADDLPEGVSPIPIANSDEVQVGQKTIAIGNPFGLDSTVSAGIVSAISRYAPSIGRVEVPYVQTDAAINPGNSGGPLLNSQGEVIGVNTSILAGGTGVGGQPGNIGIGFAVPSNLLQDNLAQLEEGGFVDLQSRARLGIQIGNVSDYPEAVRNNLNLPDEGIVIQTVEPGSAAEAAGLRGAQFDVNFQGTPIPAGGDVVTAVNGEPVATTGELQSAVLSQSEGDAVTLTIVRDGQEQDVEVELAVVPQNAQGTEQEGN